MTTPIVVVATLVAKPGQEDRVAKTMTDLAPSVHAEPGCLLYALHKKSGTTGEFVMIEKWSSPESFDVHMRSATMREVLGILRDALASAPTMGVLEAVPAGSPELGAL